MTLSTPQRNRSGRAQVRRWDAAHEMEDVYDRMGRLVQDLFGASPVTAVARLPEWAAPADIEETDDEYIVEIDMPSVKRDDITVELRANELVVSGEIKEKERNGVLRRRSRPVGQFEHVIALPGDVDPERVDASLNDGVLTVRVGKSRASRPRKIEVHE